MGTIANLLIRLKVDTREATSELTTFGGKTKAALGKGLAPAIGALGVVGVAAKRAADDAKDLGEAQNAANVVFGKASPIVQNFATKAARQAGLSMQQFLEAATPVGAALQNYGMSAETAATTSVNLTKRAADMASVFNTSVPEALEAIQAGLRGEADPLERFGADLSQAAVQAKAASMGLLDAKGNMDKHAEAQARVALLMDQTNKLQGDFVRTSGSAANSAKVNAAEAKNLSANLGNGLLPAYEGINAVIGKTLQFMASHRGLTKTVVAVVTLLAGAVVVVNAAMRVWAATQAVVNAVMAMNPFMRVVMLLLALGAALVVAWHKSETFRNIVTGAWNAVKVAASAVASFVTEKIPAAFQRVLSWTRANWPKIAMIILAPFAPVVALATNAFGIRSRFMAAMTAVKSWTAARIGDIVGFFRGLPGRLVGLAVAAGTAVLTGLGRGLAALGSRLVGWILAPVRAVISKVNSAITGINNTLSFRVSMPGPIPDINVDPPDIPHIPMLARGGVVTGPTLAMIGEGGGPEAVVPLSRAHQFGFGGGGVTVVVEDRTFAGMSPEVRRRVARELEPELRRLVGMAA